MKFSRKPISQYTSGQLLLKKRIILILSVHERHLRIACLHQWFMEKRERSYKVGFKEKSYVCLRTTPKNPVGESGIPNCQEAVVQYEQIYNGMLMDEYPFGHDPLIGNNELIEERNNHFFQNFVVDDIFAQCVYDFEYNYLVRTVLK